MDKHQQLINLRIRKLGVLIRDARLSQRRSKLECSEAMGITELLYMAFEKGEKAPSLPQIEAFAYYLNIPLEHFWGTHTLSGKKESDKAGKGLSEVRDRYLGTRLHLARTQANLTLEQLSEKTSIRVEILTSYETGKVPIPLPELEILAHVFDLRIQDIFDQQGLISKWRAQHLSVQKFLELPPRLQDFVSKPVNQPYIELAIRLSDLNVDKLRAVAESLLEITY
jgi:transcriptional regulator with XRE-family HTH domain